MAITFNQFFAAIAQQESGGSYSATGSYVNGDRAYGKYQVMGANIPSWTRKYYGKSLTPSQFLANHAAQEAVARGVLQSYFNKYGARGAAAAWYSGNPNLSESTKSQPGGPSIKAYVDSVMAIAAGKPAGGSSDIGGVVTPSLSAAELAEQYGFVSSFLNSNPELKTLFQKAVAGTWSADKFQASLRNTKWWKTHSDHERQYLLQLKADPATAKQVLQQATTHIQQLAAQLGVANTAYVKKQLSAAAYDVVAKGWSDDQLRNFLGQYVYFYSGNPKGEGGDDWNQLHSYAYSQGVTMSGDWYGTASRAVVRGTSSLQDFKSQIDKIAKAQFPQWQKQIDGGQTVSDLAQPYMQSMAQILELPGGSINLLDPTIKKAMSFTDPKTGQKGAMPLWQFENTLRSDPRWKGTQNAQDSLMQVGHQVLTDFGLSY